MSGWRCFPCSWLGSLIEWIYFPFTVWVMLWKRSQIQRTDMLCTGQEKEEGMNEMVVLVGDNWIFPDGTYHIKGQPTDVNISQMKALEKQGRRIHWLIFDWVAGCVIAGSAKASIERFLIGEGLKYEIRRLSGWLFQDWMVKVWEPSPEQALALYKHLLAVAPREEAT